LLLDRQRQKKDDGKLREEETMGETLENVATTLSAFKKEVGELFELVDKRFEQVDKRFEQVDKRFEQVDKRFEQVDKRFESIEKQIAAEGEATRRHFDIVAEQMKAERNLALDQSIATSKQLVAFRVTHAAEHAALEKRLDNHERRLDNHERRVAKLEEHD
jgi:tetrahydromethanopterin S-methyltransferase subunit G